MSIVPREKSSLTARFPARRTFNLILQWQHRIAHKRKTPRLSAAFPEFSSFSGFCCKFAQKQAKKREG